MDLVRFDLGTGLWIAVHHLAAHLGWMRLLRTFWGLVLRTGQDPLRDQPVPQWAQEQENLVRHQLRPALLLDEVLAEDLGLSVETRLPILKEVIAETGAAFVATHARGVEVNAWRGAAPEARQGWARGLTGRFFNARVEDLRTDSDGIRFNITACRFATLVQDLGRPHLAPLFCAADSVYFERPGSPVQLQRQGTLGQGQSICDFHLALVKKESDP